MESKPTYIPIFLDGHEMCHLDVDSLDVQEATTLALWVSQDIDAYNQHRAETAQEGVDRSASGRLPTFENETSAPLLRLRGIQDKLMQSLLEHARVEIEDTDTLYRAFGLPDL